MTLLITVQGQSCQFLVSSSLSLSLCVCVVRLFFLCTYPPIHPPPLYPYPTVSLFIAPFLPFTTQLCVIHRNYTLIPCSPPSSLYLQSIFSLQLTRSSVYLCIFIVVSYYQPICYLHYKPFSLSIKLERKCHTDI